MRAFGAIFFHWLHQVTFAVWLGGIAVLGGVAAPAVFRAAKAAGDTHWGMPLYNFAGAVTGAAFGRFNYVVLVAGALMLVSGLAAGSLAGLCRRRVLLRAALTALAWGIVAWLAFGMFPQMLALREQGRMDAFDALHRTYSSLYSAQALLLLAVAGLTAWMHLDRAASRQPAGSRPAAEAASPAPSQHLPRPPGKQPPVPSSK
ncbi:MAG TPA: hypothetical protein VFU47_15795 [Armatimonadota bacterium]|nr:hypothetical protein [Armatimonadota bacterium]